MEKFQNKYRIPSSRARFWDYRWSAEYFITICTHNQKPYFGEIIDEAMTISETGEIVNAEWLKTFEIRPDMNLYMGEFVIMPNHFHAIIGIGENKYNLGQDLIDDRNPINSRDAMHCVSTGPAEQTNCTIGKFGPQSKNLSSIIRGFKSCVTKQARMIDINFAWQSRYYDHIIRTDKSFSNIVEYIVDNPTNWEKDKFYIE